MAAAAAPSAKSVILITGASRGIGLGLVEVFVAKGWRVIAAARDPAKSEGLQAVVKAHAATVSTVALDVSDSKSIAGLPGALATLKVDRIDVVINNAGIKSPSETKTGKAMTLATETEDDFMACYKTNVIGTWDVTQKVLPLLRATTLPAGAKVVNISSIMGSIDALVSSPAGAGAHNPVYRLTKAALNSLSACQAREFNADHVAAAAAKTSPLPPLITVLAVHPGWVQTDMGKAGGRQPPVTVPQSCQGIASLVDNAKPSADVAFVQFDGAVLKW